MPRIPTVAHRPLAHRLLAHRVVALALDPRPATRFLPGTALGFLLVAAPITAAFIMTAGPGRQLGLGDAVVPALRWMLAMTVGYAAAVRVMSPALRTDAAPAGRRGVVAGVAAAWAMLIACMLMGPVAEWVRLAAALAVGAGSGGVMFWPWRLGRAEREALRVVDARQPTGAATLPHA